MNIVEILENIDRVYKVKQDVNNLLEKINTKETFNNFLTKCATYTQLMGPSGLVVYKVNDKWVFMFQDTHIVPVQKCDDVCTINPPGCIWINDFLRELFLISPFCVDFFLETITFLQTPKKTLEIPAVKTTLISKTKSLKNQDPRGLSKSIREFANCLGPIKKKCDVYKRVRFHNIEFRRFLFDDYEFFSNSVRSIYRIPIYYLYKTFHNNMEKNLELIKDDIDINNYDEKMKSFLNRIDKYQDMFDSILAGDMNKFGFIMNGSDGLFRSFTGQTVEYYVGDWSDYFVPSVLNTSSPYPKLKKQFDDLPENIKTATIEYVKGRFRNNVQPIIDDIKVDRNKLDEYIQELSESGYHMDDATKKLINRLIISFAYSITNKLDSLNFYFSILIFDSYTIGRILKSIFVYRDSSVIMMYAGAEHIGAYTRLFDYLQTKNLMIVNKEIEIGKYPHNACINFTDYSAEWNKVIAILKSLNEVSTCAVSQGIQLD